MLVFLSFWFIISIVVGIAASSRGRSGFGWFLLAVLISPILALLFLIAFPPKQRHIENEIDDIELQRNIRRGRRKLRF